MSVNSLTGCTCSSVTVRRLLKLLISTGVCFFFFSIFLLHRLPHVTVKALNVAFYCFARSLSWMFVVSTGEVSSWSAKTCLPAHDIVPQQTRDDKDSDRRATREGSILPALFFELATAVKTNNKWRRTCHVTTLIISNVETQSFVICWFINQGQWAYNSSASVLFVS